jgi:syndecan 4
MKLLALGLLLYGCSALAAGEVAPGNGLYYSDHGGYENKCPISDCSSILPVCGIGFYRSGCWGNSTGDCTQCNNNKPSNSSYSTKGGLVSDCAWVCDTGFTQVGQTCVSSTQCITPKPGNATYSNTNAPNCDFQCNAGYFNAQKSVNPDTCTECESGTFSLQGATVCSECRVGTYSTMTASPSEVNCQNCPTGKFSTAGKGKNSNVCTSCGAGTYSTAVGANSSATCMECSAGTASTSLGANNGAVCVGCLPGKYTSAPGKTVCDNCDAGTFSNSTGATKCFNCDPNTYASTTGLSLCTMCSYCTAAGSYRSGCGPISAGFCTSCSNALVI